MERDKILIDNYKALLLSDCKKVFPDAKRVSIVIDDDGVNILVYKGPYEYEVW